MRECQILVRMNAENANILWISHITISVDRYCICTSEINYSYGWLRDCACNFLVIIWLAQDLYFLRSIYFLV